MNYCVGLVLSIRLQSLMHDIFFKFTFSELAVKMLRANKSDDS